MAQHHPLQGEALELVARRFAALGEPMRLRVLQALFAGERNVTELVDASGGTQANISHHLRTLLAAQVVRRRKEGLQVYYEIADPSIFRLCELVCGSLEKTFARQAGHLAESAGSLNRIPAGRRRNSGGV